MKNIKYILLLIISITILNSCKKDDSDPTEPEGEISFVLKIDGEEIDANTQETAFVKSYTVVGAAGELGFNITNKKNEDIKLRMTIVGVLEGANGGDMQVCFETCSASINLDQTEVRTIAVGQTTTTAETHIYNGQAGNRNYECTVKINEVDENNVDISDGKEVYFTYKYVAP